MRDDRKKLKEALQSWRFTRIEIILLVRWVNTHFSFYFIYLFIYYFFYFHLVVSLFYRGIISNIFKHSNYFTNCNMFITCLESYRLAREYLYGKKWVIYFDNDRTWLLEERMRDSLSINSVNMFSKIFPAKIILFLYFYMCVFVCFACCRSFLTLTSVTSIVSSLTQTALSSDYYWRRITIGSWKRWVPLS